MFILKVLASVLLFVLFLITYPFVIIGYIFEKFVELYVLLMSRWLSLLESLFQFIAYEKALKALREEKTHND